MYCNGASPHIDRESVAFRTCLAGHVAEALAEVQRRSTDALEAPPSEEPAMSTKPTEHCLRPRDYAFVAQERAPIWDATARRA